MSWIQSKHALTNHIKIGSFGDGCPGPWSNCKGPRQDDLLSPYMFLLVEDTLQNLVSHVVRHPVALDHLCLVLQYADDTLIVVRGEPEDVATLKILSDHFAAAIGLTINYNKSNVVLIIMSTHHVTWCLDILSCNIYIIRRVWSL
jgi:hypothetical protein